MSEATGQITQSNDLQLFLLPAHACSLERKLLQDNVLYRARIWRYAAPIMVSRDKLKALIDQLPEPSLEIIRQILEHHINPPLPHPKMEEMQRQSQEYKRRVEQRYRETRKPGTFGGMSGVGNMGFHQGTPFGRHGFHYWDDKALVHQSVQFFDSQEIEVMERLSFSPDRTTFLCSLELSSGGHTVCHEDRFPISQAQK